MNAVSTNMDNQCGLCKNKCRCKFHLRQLLCIQQLQGRGTEQPGIAVCLPERRQQWCSLRDTQVYAVYPLEKVQNFRITTEKCAKIRISMVL